MKTTYKVAFVVAATMASSTAFADSNSFDGLSDHSGLDNATSTSHSINVKTNVATPPLTFVDTILPAAAAGTSLNAQGLVTTSAFETKTGHIYILSTPTNIAHASFSATQNDVTVANTRLVANEAATAYVQLSTGNTTALTAGVHNYTFVVTDYSA
ncbi:hypothetical protein DLP51_19490 [Salmonella enterica]|nr:hypothetical protein [Salmonella enterica]